MSAPNRAERVTTSGEHPADTALAELDAAVRTLAQLYVEIVRTVGEALADVFHALREAGVISPESLREDRK